MLPFSCDSSCWREMGGADLFHGALGFSFMLANDKLFTKTHTHHVVNQWASIELVFLMHQQEQTYLSALQLKQNSVGNNRLKSATAHGRKEIWFPRWDLASLRDASVHKGGFLISVELVLSSLVTWIATISPSCCLQLMSPELKWHSKCNCGLGIIWVWFSG